MYRLSIEETSMAKSTIDLSIRLPTGLHLQLKEEADRRGITIAEAIRQRLHASFGGEYVDHRGVMEIDALCDASQRFAVAVVAVAPGHTDAAIHRYSALLRGGVEELVDAFVPAVDDPEGKRQGALLATLILNANITEKV
jgi:hypothetical protein